MLLASQKLYTWSASGAMKPDMKCSICLEIFKERDEIVEVSLQHRTLGCCRCNQKVKSIKAL